MDGLRTLEKHSNQARALLTHHTAVARGTAVDKPRNLAKTVMVE